jgi:hypothetical protein
MIYKIKDWIQLDKCDPSNFSCIQKLNLIEKYISKMDEKGIAFLSKNPHAIPYLMLNENQHKICWGLFLTNSNAIDYIKKYSPIVNHDWEKVDELLMNSNPEAIKIIENNLYDMINTHFAFWNWISSNPSAVSLLEKNFVNIDWRQISKNPNAIHLLERNKDKIDWSNLSGNKNAIDILLQYPHKIDWQVFSSNTNPIAIKMLEENPDKIDWRNLSRNSSAIHLLEANQSKVCYDTILQNDNIYQYDYAEMKLRMDILRKEMMIKVWHPLRVIKWLEAGCEDILE